MPKIDWLTFHACSNETNKSGLKGRFTVWWQQRRRRPRRRNGSNACVHVLCAVLWGAFDVWKRFKSTKYNPLLIDRPIHKRAMNAFDYVTKWVFGGDGVTRLLSFFGKPLIILISHFFFFSVGIAAAAANWYLCCAFLYRALCCFGFFCFVHGQLNFIDACNMRVL